ncbi:hypothetical protein [Treponema sp.]|uniref:NADase-type glycan-binding domain-containing protein n=1 Tax=Treponema sp. TaxID=166 RepID=UPI00257D5D25|nr:hypothetical protein [Treponema sp.]MBE6354327.1 hypothetical protein [Treponema sp.]
MKSYFNKKLFTVSVLFAVVSVFSYADEIEDFKSILSKNSGYFYNEEEGSVIYFNFDGSTLNRTKFDINFINKTTKTSIESRTSFFPDNYPKIKLDYKIKNGKLLSIREFDGTYIRLDAKNEKELIPEIKKKCLNRFERICGTYTDSNTQRIFSISRKGEKFLIQVTYPASENIENKKEELFLRDNNYLQGNNYGAEFYNKRLFILDPYIPPAYPTHDEYEEEIKYIVHQFPIKELQTEEENLISKSIDFYRSWYFYNDDGTSKKVYLSDKAASLLKKSDWEYNVFKIFECYKMYQDEMGWKHLELIDENGTQKFLLIDGEDMYALFAYTGNSLTSDKDAIANQFTDKSNLVETMEFLPNMRTSNGSHFANPKASSTLKDKNYEYKIEGTLQVFNPLESETKWCKNNLPWVEGQEDDGIGETIEFDIIPQTWEAIEGINFRILNGYVDPLKPYLFKQNNRIKKLLVQTDTGFSTELIFNDAVEFTKIELPKETKHIKLTIKEIYKGTKYSDTCITAFEMNYRIWDR